MPDRPVVVVAASAFEDATLHDAVRELVEADLDVTPCVTRRRRLTVRGAHLTEMVPVEPFEVDGVDAVLHDLEPVARDDRPADVAERVIGDEEVEAGEGRRRRGTEIGEHEPAELADRVGGGRGPCHGGSRLVSAVTSTHSPQESNAHPWYGHRSAVSSANPSASDVPRCGHRASTSPGSPEVVRNRARSSPRTRTGIAAPDRELDGSRDRQPVPPEQLAHRRAATDAREGLGLLGGHGPSSP